jgi:putative endonuclease
VENRQRHLAKATVNDCREQGETAPGGHYVYMVCCANGALYTGYARDVERRVARHNAGLGARYTRSHRPVALVAAWRYDSRATALRVEDSIKRLSRTRKLALVKRGWMSQGEMSGPPSDD